MEIIEILYKNFLVVLLVAPCAAWGPRVDKLVNLSGSNTDKTHRDGRKQDGSAGLLMVIRMDGAVAFI